MSVTRRLPFVLIVCGILLLDARAASAQRQIDVQYKRKADMLCPLAGILLPSQSFEDGIFRIGVLGGDPFDGFDQFGNPVNHLDEMVASKGTYKGQRLVVHRFSSANDYRVCDVLFISAVSASDSDERSAEERLAAVLRMRHPQPLLVVADTAGLAAKGATINFVLKNAANGVPKVSFEINPQAAKRAGLKVSPGLLRLASRIVQERA